MIYTDEGKNAIPWLGCDFKALFSTGELVGLLRQGVFTYKEAKNWKELTTYQLISMPWTILSFCCINLYPNILPLPSTSFYEIVQNNDKFLWKIQNIL